MSEETENLPFACTVIGCNQNFSNVDRLNVHLEMHKGEGGDGESEQLRLKMTRKEQIMDQTPTPTRFLRVCDDEGIFQDMQKQNPFDEGFQAGLQTSSQDPSGQFSGVETLAAVAVASAAASPSQSDDDLRTSEAAAAAAAASSNGVGSGATTTPTSVPTSSYSRLTATFMNGDVVVPVPPPASLANPDASVPMAIPPASFLPKGGSTAGGVPSSVRSTPKVSGPPVAADTKKETLARVHPMAASTTLSDQNALAAAVSAANSVIQQNESMVASSSHSVAAGSLSNDLDEGVQTVTISIDRMSDADGSYSSMDDGTPFKSSMRSSPTSSGSVKRRRTTDDLDPQEKRARFLQRNREAATRCREKRKEWIATLERRSQDLARHNAQLQAEVNALRNERAHLKVLLLSHKDCPVTVQQQKQLQIPASLLPQVQALQSAAAAAAGEVAAATTDDEGAPEPGTTATAAEPAVVSTSSAATSTAMSTSAAVANALAAAQPMQLTMPSLVMPVSNQAGAAGDSGTPKGTVTLALPTPLNLTGGTAQNVASPLTPLLMFPLTSDHLQMAAAASTTPNLDFNSIHLLQQLQQHALRAQGAPSAENSPSKSGAAPQPTTPSTAAIQALLGSAQLAVLQAAIQQQQQLHQIAAINNATAQTSATGDSSFKVEGAVGAPVVEEVHEVEL